MCEVPSRDVILKGLQREMPISVLASLDLRDKKVGLVIVDEVVGFCKHGNLAPPAPDAVIQSMIDQTDALAQRFCQAGAPILILQDTHDPNRPEPPYPPHCIEGSGEEKLVEELAWLTTPGTEGLSTVTVIKKDCICGWIGGVYYSISGDGNFVIDWIQNEEIEVVVVVGICTDICDLQFVHPVLSARNRGMLGLDDNQGVVIYVPGCATYDLPREIAETIDLPGGSHPNPHPRDLAQHTGLYLMMMSGAILVKDISL